MVTDIFDIDKMIAKLFYLRFAQCLKFQLMNKVSHFIILSCTNKK